MEKKLTRKQEVEAVHILCVKARLYQDMGFWAATCGEVGILAVLLINSVVSAIVSVWWIQLLCVIAAGVIAGCIIYEIVKKLSFKCVTEELEILTPTGRELKEKGGQ